MRAEVKIGSGGGAAYGRGTGADDALARQAVEAIRQQLPLCWLQIRVIARGGRVRLEGSVEWLHQREEAESVVRQLPGVVDVDNAIALGRLPAPAAAPTAGDKH